MARLNPYLSFDGNAREAMAFYAALFDGTVETMTFADMGNDGPEANNVMHSSLTAPNGFNLMGADTPPGEKLNRGNDVAVSLSGLDSDDGVELRRYWAGLSDGGVVTVPFEKQMWGDEFGMCTDKFGVTWLVNVGAAPA